MSILVVLEQDGGRWHPASMEALAAAQQLGAALGLPVSAALPGHGVAPLAAEAAARKLERVYAIQHELLGAYTADGFTAALESLIRSTAPELVLFPHTYRVRDFAPKLATRFSQAMVSDVVAFRVEDGTPVFVRQVFQGKLMADVRIGGPAPHFVSIQAGAFRADQAELGAGAVEIVTPALDAGGIRVKPGEPFRQSAATVDLGAAARIVAAGRGLENEGDLDMIRELAEALGAELAASRPLCDNGWLPMERQVGSSGQTVAPKLYVAIGISGAIQHLVGMKGSQTIVAINRDPDAPIFEVADYGIAGDLYDVVPALIDALRDA